MISAQKDNDVFAVEGMYMEAWRVLYGNSCEQNIAAVIELHEVSPSFLLLFGTLIDEDNVLILPRKECRKVRPDGSCSSYDDFHCSVFRGW